MQFQHYSIAAAWRICMLDQATESKLTVVCLAVCLL